VNQKINWFYVITPDVVVFSGMPLELLDIASQPTALACASVLGRATFHAAQLNVPMVLRSEVISLQRFPSSSPTLPCGRVSASLEKR
jgi:hypothetical protein